jgi:phenylalanyl-tRNA synthetase beta subunit
MPRTSLLPGLLKTLEYNQSHSPPFRIFELSDVVIKDLDNSTGAINQRHLAALYSD